MLGVLQNVIDYGMDVQRAVNALRVHEQWLPEPVALESGAISKDTRKRLSALGYTFSSSEGGLGVVEAVLVDRDGTMHGASDPRRPGGAAVAPEKTH
jgi:gamma-glutamyltranspeptidase / glutathione hydrolase